VRSPTRGLIASGCTRAWCAHKLRPIPARTTAFRSHAAARDRRYRSEASAWHGGGDAPSNARRSARTARRLRRLPRGDALVRSHVRRPGARARGVGSASRSDDRVDCVVLPARHDRRASDAPSDRHRHGGHAAWQHVEGRAVATSRPRLDRAPHGRGADRPRRRARGSAEVCARTMLWYTRSR
jgi:hypothetical protein